jgi:hypothetical protein
MLGLVRTGCQVIPGFLSLGQVRAVKVRLGKFSSGEFRLGQES